MPNTDALNRSRITNGTSLLPNVDGRSTWARRCRDVAQLLIADKGGKSELSEAELSIIRRIAVLQTELEYQEAKFAKLRDAGSSPTPTDLDLYSRLTGQLRRLLEASGIQRRAKDIAPASAPQRGALDGFIDGDEQ